MQLPPDLVRRVAVQTTNAVPGTTNSTLQVAAPGAGTRYRLWAFTVAVLRTAGAGSLVQVELQGPSGTGQGLIAVTRAGSPYAELVYPGGLVVAENAALYLADSSDVGSQLYYSTILYSSEPV